jgi:hypothetical protein
MGILMLMRILATQSKRLMQVIEFEIDGRVKQFSSRHQEQGLSALHAFIYKHGNTLLLLIRQFFCNHLFLQKIHFLYVD